LENRYALLLARHRPDLAERYGATPVSVTFEPIDEATAEAHVDELRQLLTEADTLSGGARADSLRDRLRREIAETGPGGALHRDALLWLDVVDAAARAPFALGAPTAATHPARGNATSHPARGIARRHGAHAGRPTPDPAAFEARLAGLNSFSAPTCRPGPNLAGKAGGGPSSSRQIRSLPRPSRSFAVGWPPATSARGMRKLAVRLNCWCSALTTGSLQR